MGVAAVVQGGLSDLVGVRKKLGGEVLRKREKGDQWLKKGENKVPIDA